MAALAGMTLAGMRLTSLAARHIFGPEAVTVSSLGPRDRGCGGTPLKEGAIADGIQARQPLAPTPSTTAGRFQTEIPDYRYSGTLRRDRPAVNATELTLSPGLG